MGLFSGIKKAFKKVWKGIKKVFKKVLAGVGKILNSKWGKILMVGLAVFTGGMALAGGFQAFSASAAAGNSFMTNFVAGAKGFMSALANPVEQAKKMFGTAAQAGQAGATATKAAEVGAQELAGQAAQEAVGQTAAEQAVQQAAGGIAEGGAQAAAAGTQTVQGTGGMGGIADLGAEAATQAATTAAQTGAQTATQTAAQVAKEPGWLSKAAEFGKEFITSPAGAAMIQGFGEGGAAEEEQKFRDRIRRRWMDPNNPFAQMQPEGFTVGRGGPPRIGPTGPVSASGPVQTSGALPGEPVPVG